MYSGSIWLFVTRRAWAASWSDTPGGTEVGCGAGLTAGRRVDRCRRGAAVERLGVEGVDVLALDPVVADADVLAVRRRGPAVVRAGCRTWCPTRPGWPAGAAGRGGHRRSRGCGGGQVGGLGGRHGARAGPGRTGRRWSGTDTAFEAPTRGVDGRHAGQGGERGRVGGGDHLDVPPLGQAAVAGADHVVVRRDRHVVEAARATGCPAGRRRWPTGRWSAGGRCRWPWPCTGSAAASANSGTGM